ncbi:MAG: hypothetical protein M3Q23_01480, partial [Actinomycetota bacterium]|nr:hypothetical protein [Actinomycetota bacterium]
RLRQMGEARETLAELYIDTVVDSTMFLALRARDRVALGEIEPRTFRDALRAVEAWHRFRPTPETVGVPLHEYDADIATLIETARRHMDRDQYANFLEHLKAVGREPRPGGARE